MCVWAGPVPTGGDRPLAAGHLAGSAGAVSLKRAPPAHAGLRRVETVSQRAFSGVRPSPDPAVGPLAPFGGPPPAMGGVALLAGGGGAGGRWEGGGRAAGRPERRGRRTRRFSRSPWSLAIELLHGAWERPAQSLSHVGIDLRCLDRRAAWRLDRSGPDPPRGALPGPAVLSRAHSWSHLPGGGLPLGGDMSLVGMGHLGLEPSVVGCWAIL